jgi:hypothetical protein
MTHCVDRRDSFRTHSRVILAPLFFLGSRIPVAPDTPIGVVTLSLPEQSYHQLAKDELVHMLMPQAPLYPNSRFYVPVFLEEPLTDRAPITALTIK